MLEYIVFGDRVKQHYNDLNKNRHPIKNLQHDWKIYRFSVGYLYIGDDYQNVENEYINSIHKDFLYNKLQYNVIPPLSFFQQRDFWNKIDIGDIDECWNWRGTIQIDGYGRKNYCKKKYISHRISYYLTYGIDPKGMFVMHECNNKLCCNPSHLKLGTNQENTINAHKDGLIKIKRGEEHNQSLNIKPCMVYGIKHGNSWTHITTKEDIEQMKQYNHYSKTNEGKKKIFERWKLESMNKIKKRYIRKMKWRYGMIEKRISGKPRKPRRTNKFQIDEVTRNYIKQEILHGKSKHKLVEELGLPPNRISMIWKEIQEEKDRPYILYTSHILYIVELLKEGKMTISDIADKFQSSVDRILNIKNGKVRKDIISKEDVEEMNVDEVFL